MSSILVDCASLIHPTDTTYHKKMAGLLFVDHAAVITTLQFFIIPL
jgi:hypothetical protein